MNCLYIKVNKTTSGQLTSHTTPAGSHSSPPSVCLGVVLSGQQPYRVDLQDLRVGHPAGTDSLHSC